MTATAGAATLTFRWPIAARGGLPRAQFTIVLQPALRGGSSVGLAHVSVPSRGDVAETSTSFDDGRVVVDRAPGGRVLGVEFLEDRDLGELPEFARAIAAERNREDHALLLAAHATAMLNWARIGFFVESATRRDPGSVGRRGDGLEALRAALRHPPASVRRWRTGSVAPD